MAVIGDSIVRSYLCRNVTARSMTELRPVLGQNCGPHCGFVVGIAPAAALRYQEQMQTTFKTTSGTIKRFSEAPTSEKVAEISRLLDERKGSTITTVDLAGQGAFADALVVVTAGTVRHGQSLADAVAEFCREHNYEFLRIEGYEAGQWILVDLNDIVVNIFLEPVRELYRLETLWEHVAAGRGKETQW